MEARARSEEPQGDELIALQERQSITVGRLRAVNIADWKSIGEEHDLNSGYTTILPIGKEEFKFTIYLETQAEATVRKHKQGIVIAAEVLNKDEPVNPILDYHIPSGTFVYDDAHSLLKQFPSRFEASALARLADTRQGFEELIFETWSGEEQEGRQVMILSKPSDPEDSNYPDTPHPH